MAITPINPAEAIIEPFWDTALSELPRWTIADGTAHGLAVNQNWCWVGFEWARRPARGPALRMSRRFDLPCDGYDHLLVSAMAPPRSVLRISATTERGPVRLVTPPAPAQKKEYAVPLRGARRLKTVTLEIDAGTDGVAAGWFNWLGLQNARLLPRVLTASRRFDTRWDKYLQPETYEPRFRPAYGLAIDARELAVWRRRHDRFLRRHRQSPITRAAAAARRIVPERRIGEFLNFWTDTRYCRARDHGNELLQRGPNAAVAGLLLRDKQLLRLAARYAMALAMTGRWDDGMICAFPGSAFDHRCFVQSLGAYECALLLDLAGEMFTDAGRAFLLRRIGQDALGAINYNAWRYEYIFHCNQLAWFSPGRLLGYAVLERAMPRVRPYLDLAYRDLRESLALTVLPDGGYVEGPSYFACVGYHAGLSLHFYARARGRSFAAVVPPSMRRTGAYGDAVVSTDDAQDVIPICDARPMGPEENVAVMAHLHPRRQWVAMFRKRLRRTCGQPETWMGARLEPRIPRRAPPPPACVRLRHVGLLASTRHLGRHAVKLLLLGNKAGAGHTHEDKGSFVLEFAGDTFAMDPGTCDYSHPLAGLLHNCERHNMLVPAGLVERPHPRCPLDVDVKPRGRGDARRFAATINASPGWEGTYRRWVRRWQSPEPGVLVVEDRYALARGTGVESYWNTRLPVTMAGRRVTIRGRQGVVELETSADCRIRVDDLPLLDGTTQRRIAICRNGTAGTLRVVARLRARA